MTRVVKLHGKREVEHRDCIIVIEHRTAVNDYKYTAEIRRVVTVPIEGKGNTFNKALEAARDRIDRVLGEET